MARDKGTREMPAHDRLYSSCKAGGRQGMCPANALIDMPAGDPAGGMVAPFIPWSGANVLGMSRRPAAVAALVETARRSGLGDGGDKAARAALEATLAELHDAQAACTFASRGDTRTATLAALASLMPDLLILSDEAWAADTNAVFGFEMVTFQRDDPADLAALLRQGRPRRPVMVAFTALNRVNGAVAPVKSICDLARGFGALTWLDESGALGLYGPRGGGIAERDGARGMADIVEGSLAPALGVAGGYVAGDTAFCGAVQASASRLGIIRLAAPMAAAASCNAAHLRHSVAERIALALQVERTRRALRTVRIPMAAGRSHIIMVPVAGALQTRWAARLLLDQFGHRVETVDAPNGCEGLRIQPTPLHKTAAIEDLADALDRVWDQLGLPRDDDASAPTWNVVPLQPGTDDDVAPIGYLARRSARKRAALG